MRYFYLYLGFLRFSFSRALEFRMDFFFRIFMDLAYYGISLAFFTILYQHTSALGGWTLDQVYIFICGLLLVDAVIMAVFSNNLWWLPIFINRGDLDYYLVRPVSSLFMLSLRDFAANSFVNMLMAGSLVTWALSRYPDPLGTVSIMTYFGFLGIGVIVEYLIRMIFIIPVFWLHSSRGLDEVSWRLSDLAERPHQIYSSWLRIAMITVLPLAFFGSIPAHVLFDGLTLGTLLHALAIVVAFSLFTLWFWRRGLRAYASASS